jgi:hypothetical protein
MLVTSDRRIDRLAGTTVGRGILGSGENSAHPVQDCLAVGEGRIEENQRVPGYGVDLRAAHPGDAAQGTCQRLLIAAFPGRHVDAHAPGKGMEEPGLLGDGDTHDCYPVLYCCSL